MTNSPTHFSSTGNGWKQSLLISPSGTSSGLFLHNLLLFLCIPAAKFSAREQNHLGTCKHPSPFWQTHTETFVSATHPDPSSSFTGNLTSHKTLQWPSIPSRQGLCRSTTPFLSKLSVYINPSTFTEEVYKPSRSCYSTATVTF